MPEFYTAVLIALALPGAGVLLGLIASCTMDLVSFVSDQIAKWVE